MMLEMLEEVRLKTIVDRSRRDPQSVPVLHALGWRRPRLRSIILGASSDLAPNEQTYKTQVYDVDREEIRRRDTALPRLTVATLKILKSTFHESCRLLACWDRGAL